jgi:hypothetical protein
VSRKFPGGEPLGFHACKCRADVVHVKKLPGSAPRRPRLGSVGHGVQISSDAPCHGQPPAPRGRPLRLHANVRLGALIRVAGLSRNNIAGRAFPSFSNLVSTRPSCSSASATSFFGRS